MKRKHFTVHNYLYNWLMDFAIKSKLKDKSEEEENVLFSNLLSTCS